MFEENFMMAKKICSIKSDSSDRYNKTMIALLATKLNDEHCIKNYYVLQ